MNRTQTFIIGGILGYGRHNYCMTEILYHVYPVASGETGKIAGFSVSYLKMAQNLPGKSQYIEIHNKIGSSRPPHLSRPDRHILYICHCVICKSVNYNCSMDFLKSRNLCLTV